MNLIASWPGAAFSVGLIGCRLEVSWKRSGVKEWDEGPGRVMNLWESYPQTLAAACLALNVFGTGGAGVATFAAFALLPIVFKVIVLKSRPGSPLGSIAGCLDHIFRITAKLMIVSDGIQLAIQAPSLLGRVVFFAGAAAGFVFAFGDFSFTATYALADRRDFYNWCKRTADL